MEKNSTTPGFFVKKEWGKLFERLSNEEIGLIIKNMYRLDDNEELIEMTLPAEMLFFGSIAPTQEFNRDRYERKITANRMNGAKGGAPVGNQNARKQENITQNNPNQHKGIVTEKGKEIVTEIGKFKEIDKSKEIGIEQGKVDNNHLNVIDNKISSFINDIKSDVETFNFGYEKKEVENYSNKENNISTNNSLPPGAMTTAQYFRSKGKL
jgi:hypothetical protein